MMPDALPGGVPREARYCTHCGPKVERAATGRKKIPKQDTSSAVLMSEMEASIWVNSIRPRTAAIASETMASVAPVSWALRRDCGARLLTQPPTIEPTLNAARKVEMSQAHTMIDDPKCGLSSREASS